MGDTDSIVVGPTDGVVLARRNYSLPCKRLLCSRRDPTVDHRHVPGRRFSVVNR